MDKDSTPKDGNAELKNALISAGISEEMSKFVAERDNKALNVEGMELGDKITIIGVSDKPSESANFNPWADILTTGDRQTVSISRLVGTSKRAKYFNAEKRKGETEDGEPLVEAADGFESRKLLDLPHREADALIKIMQECIGKTYEVVAVARECGQYNQTFYLFAEAED